MKYRDFPGSPVCKKHGDRRTYMSVASSEKSRKIDFDCLALLSVFSVFSVVAFRTSAVVELLSPIPFSLPQTYFVRSHRAAFWQSTQG